MSLFSYQPRRNVPWGAFDVAILMLAYFAVPLLVVSAAWSMLSSPEEPQPAAVQTRPDTAHPLQHVLLESRNPWAFGMCILLAVVIAPASEEVLFRLVLQGWLEAAERRRRRHIRWLRSLPVGALPILLSSLAFAALHYREAAGPKDVSIVTILLAAQGAASLLTLAMAFCWLKFAAGANTVDLGIVPRRLPGDVVLGLLACLVVTLPVYFACGIASQMLPKNIAPDPVAIFLLSIALGTLYCRTHRIAPCIVMHMAFNAVAILLALWGQ